MPKAKNNIVASVLNTEELEVSDVLARLGGHDETLDDSILECTKVPILEYMRRISTVLRTLITHAAGCMWY